MYCCIASLSMHAVYCVLLYAGTSRLSACPIIMFSHAGCSQVATSPVSTATRAQPKPGSPAFPAATPSAGPAASPAAVWHVLPDSTGHQPASPYSPSWAGACNLGQACWTWPPQSSALLPRTLHCFSCPYEVLCIPPCKYAQALPLMPSVLADAP